MDILTVSPATPDKPALNKLSNQGTLSSNKGQANTANDQGAAYDVNERANTHNETDRRVVGSHNRTNEASTEQPLLTTPIADDHAVTEVKVGDYSEFSFKDALKDEVSRIQDTVIASTASASNINGATQRLGEATTQINTALQVAEQNVSVSRPLNYDDRTLLQDVPLENTIETQVVSQIDQSVQVHQDLNSPFLFGDVDGLVLSNTQESESENQYFEYNADQRFTGIKLNTSEALDTDQLIDHTGVQEPNKGKSNNVGNINRVTDQHEYTMLESKALDPQNTNPLDHLNNSSIPLNSEQNGDRILNKDMNGYATTALEIPELLSSKSNGLQSDAIPINQKPIHGLSDSEATSTILNQLTTASNTLPEQTKLNIQSRPLEDLTLKSDTTLNLAVSAQVDINHALNNTSNDVNLGDDQDFAYVDSVKTLNQANTLNTSSVFSMEDMLKDMNTESIAGGKSSNVKYVHGQAVHAAVGEQTSKATFNVLATELPIDTDIDDMSSSQRSSSSFLTVDNSLALRQARGLEVTDKLLPISPKEDHSHMVNELNTPMLSTEKSTASEFTNTTQINGRFSLNIQFGHQDWSPKIADKVLQMAAQNLNYAEIMLDPAELGPIQVKVQVNSDQAAVSFNAHSSQVRDALEQGSHRLRDLFQQEGLNLVDVGVGDDSNQTSHQHKGEHHSNRSGIDSELAQEDSIEPKNIVSELTLESGVDQFV